MSFQGYSREDIVDAYAAFYEIHSDKGPNRVTESKRLRELCSLSLYGDNRPYEVLSRLEPTALQAYFGLVDKRLGRAFANSALEDYARVGWPWGVTVQVENSDDDPFRVNFYVSDAIAEDWANAQGSLDGGTWESSGDPGFVYDTGQWSPDLWDRLRKEGYDLDFSSWSDPDEDDLAAARHASDCESCQDHWDFDRIREHMAQLEPLVETAEAALETDNVLLTDHWEASPGNGCEVCGTLFLKGLSR